jgi:hypothetical protein
MTRYHFRCELLSDVILSSVSATTGFNHSLDYLPGAKFLGIVAAQCYDENMYERSMDLFHNGKVRFGNAYPLDSAGNQLLPVPFNWFQPKVSKDERPIYLHHNADQASAKLQLKQLRTGYFQHTPAATIRYSLTQSFSLRSAYDREKRRAKESQLFGYYALPKGSSWYFTVDDATDTYETDITTCLQGRKRIGRSRSAEFGLVEISLERKETVAEATPLTVRQGELIVLYAKSNLCFYDEAGRNTTQPTAAALGLPQASIRWDLSQSRSRIYQTWNAKRYSRDADRMILQKGSVWVLEATADFALASHEYVVGAHLAEGFGQLMVNPDFLPLGSPLLTTNLRSEILTSPKARVLSSTALSKQDEQVVAYVARRKLQLQSVDKIDAEVNKFIQNHQGDFKGLSASQWGMVRSYAMHCENWSSLRQLLFGGQTGVLERGKSEPEWRTRGRRDKLQLFMQGINEENGFGENDKVQLLMRIAAEMAKISSSKS